MSDNGNRSLFSVIVSAIEQTIRNRKPLEISLPPDVNSAVPFADGAKDGIAMYHMGTAEITDETRELMKKAVGAAADGERETAEQLFTELGRSASALSLIDELQTYIDANIAAFSLNKLCASAVYLMTRSADRECVKFGLSILELINVEHNSKIKEVVSILGHSDEFTLFSVFVMSNWSDGNRNIFYLAKRARGWGRIHAVDRLEPDTEEIRQWLLHEGVHNTVLPAYSALVCWDKSGAAELLKSGAELSDEDFHGLRDIMTALLDEGPCDGISAVEDADGMLERFLMLAGGRELDGDDLKAIRLIKENCKENTDIAALCDKILS